MTIDLRNGLKPQAGEIATRKLGRSIASCEDAPAARAARRFLSGCFQDKARGLSKAMGSRLPVAFADFDFHVDVVSDAAYEINYFVEQVGRILIDIPSPRIGLSVNLAAHLYRFDGPSIFP